MNSSDNDDRISYQTWQTVQATVETSLDRTPSFWKYVMSAYPYFKSRLFVPGRAYDSDEHGMLAIGGSAHADCMDLDVYLATQSKETQDAAIEWMGDASQEKVAYWRGFGRGNSQPSVSRQRSRIAEKVADAIGE